MNERDISGYDAAQKTRKNDDLGRWRFASEIAEVIRSTPHEWSARIGIFGKWGEGKSTILHFLEGMLKPEGNIVFYFNPWAVQNLNEMWADFGARLLEALTHANLFVEPRWKRAARKLQKSFTSTGLVDLGEGAADLFGKGKLYKSAFGIVGNWLRPDGPQVKKIRENLGNRRVVVFIDDLDRAMPELLPKLLLSLREILDLPGFTFVLAFDNEIVAGGLLTVNKSWGDGGSFLDKILDFHYYLPPVSKEGKRLLLRNILERYCKFVPLASVAPIEHLLPDNPRKLKVLVRSLISLKPQLDRHRTDELNWVEIWLAEMVRQESYPFFMRLLEGDTLDNLVGIGYKLKKDGPKRKLGGGVEFDNTDIEKLISEVGGINDQQAERLTQLINATRTLASFHILYNWRFALRPEALTWKEFQALLARWKERQLPDTLSAWISEHSIANSMERTDIENDLFETMLNAKHNAESEAANASTTGENAAHCAEAGMILKMTEQFLLLSYMLTADRFKRFYEKSTYWIAFRVNQADADLRLAEKQALHSILESSSDGLAPAILEALAPWDTWAFMPEDRDTFSLKRDLRKECADLLLPKVERAFIASLRQPECMRALSSAQDSMAFNYLLFSGDCIPWRTGVKNALLELVRNASNDQSEWEKANDFLRLLVEAAQNKSSNIGRESAVLIVADEEFVAALWRGVTSRHIQFRMLKSYLFNRNILVGMGVKEAVLPLTPELEAANQVPQTETTPPDETETTT